jgi:outer membrane protein TolC
MKMWRLLLIGFLFVASTHAGYADEPKALTLEDLIAEALSNNPQIQAAYNTWKAAEYEIKQESGLPDPTARYTYFGKNVETRVGPQEHKYGVSQKIPFPGKLHVKAQKQRKQAAIFKEQYEATKREIIKNVKFVYYDIFWVERAIRITEEEKAILEGLEKVAQRRYEANLTPQQDVIKVQVELSRFIDKLFLLRQNRNSLVAKLNSILNRPYGTRLNVIGKVEVVEFKYDLDELRQMAQATSQELLAANLSIERAAYEKSLAKLDYLPDITLGLDYIQVGDGRTTAPNDGQDAWMGMVAINVPLWFDTLGAQLNEKRARLEATKNNYANVENSIVYEVEDLYFKVTTYKDIISLYRNALIPQTEQAFEAAKTGYETGGVDFLNWLDAERILLQTRLAYYKAITDYQKSIAYLERVVGKDL